MKIVISPFSQKLRNNKENPKNYPYWKEFIKLAKSSEHEVTQVGVKGEQQLTKDCRFNKSLEELGKLIEECDVWISVDNFFQHLANHYKKKGIVIFSKSDPNIFGYPQNINLLKDRKYLRRNQFDIWETEEFSKDAFVSANELFSVLFYFPEHIK